MARGLGMTVGESLNLPWTEYQGWKRHFTTHPPGDTHTHRLLANIWSLIASYLTRDQIEPHVIAPWLKPKETKLQRQQRLAARVAEAYQHTKH